MSKRILAIVIIAVVVFAGFGVYSNYAKGLSATEASADSSTSTSEASVADSIPDDDPLKDIKINLIVDLDQATLAKMYTDFSKLFLDSSMPNRNSERTLAASKVGWGKDGQKLYDAVSFPFSEVKKGKTDYTDEDIEKMYLELQEEIMRNPVVGDMVIQGMQYLALTDGTTLAGLNEEWVTDFTEMYDQYGAGAFVTYHTQFWEKYGYELPHDGMDVETWKSKHPEFYQATGEGITPEEDLVANPSLKALIVEEPESDELTPTATAATGDGRIGKVTTTETRYSLYVSDYYIRSAKRILSWLDRCTIIGVDTYATTTHWYLNSATNANNVRTVRNEDKDYVDQQPALVFSVDRKDGERQLLFGFNIYDMRFEVFERTAKPVKPDKTPEVPTTPKKTPSNPTTPDPDKPTNPTPDDDQPTNPTPDDDQPTNPTPDDNTPDKPEPDPVTPVDPDPDLPVKNPADDPVNQGNGDKGGGDNAPDQSDPGVATTDPSKDDMKDEHGGESTNQGHSDPSTVTPATPESTTHTSNEGNADDHNSSTVENTDQNKMNYGEEDHNQRTTVTDTNSNSSSSSSGSSSSGSSSSGSSSVTTDTHDEAAGGEFDEPPID